MQLNTSETEEMILGPVARANLPSLTITTDPIDRVTSFKLHVLGVHIDSTMSWTIHADNMVKKSHTKIILPKAT